MAEPTKIRIDPGNYVECPEIDQLVTLEMCENCDHSGKITDNYAECYWEPNTP